jgi:hypothetical protein
MQPTNSKRFYTPQFSQSAAVTIRRLAWSLGVSMPKAVDEIVGVLPSMFSPSVVCPQCRDKTKCQFCGFNNTTAVENAALSA